MSTYEPDKYLPTIDAILGVADLEQVSVKKMRRAVSELFAIDLNPYKKEINQLIMDRFYLLQEKRAKQEKDEMERKDALLAAKLAREDSKPIRKSRTTTTKKSTTKEKSKQGSSSPNHIFNREMYLSRELADVLGVDACSRPQVVKKLWAYIKDNELQDPSDKRQIICNRKLQNLFKRKSVGAFEMNKILSRHIYKPEEVESGGSSRPTPQKSLVKNEDTSDALAAEIEDNLEKDVSQLEAEMSSEED
ncbi:uncharacterized protein KGF55_004147 [Candida pseudojiufengensis]|uniref:uncharacterized protein n=1 Tax=Candida pseudojiufengensis TaxID=497109 RepID=UPI002224BEB7|nr:uncharacterized protein KGF55_004147 [Candida pseudojiufengensis]KAI5961222.1 hypothetical protein KGF55_004147 [Candida pseudojiufengensis]